MFEQKNKCQIRTTLDVTFEKKSSLWDGKRIISNAEKFFLNQMRTNTELNSLKREIELENDRENLETKSTRCRSDENKPVPLTLCENFHLVVYYLGMLPIKAKSILNIRIFVSHSALIRSILAKSFSFKKRWESGLMGNLFHTTKKEELTEMKF